MSQAAASRPRKAFKGMSLIETAVVLLMISLALVPVARNMGGQGNGPDGSTTITEATRTNTLQTIAANSIMERALADDNGDMIDTVALLPPGQSTTTPRETFFASHRRPVSYNWILRDVSYRLDGGGNLIDKQGNIVDASDPDEREKALLIAKDNRLVEATLYVYDSATSVTPKVILPTFIFRNEQDPDDPPDDRIGIMIVQDTSGSMLWSAPKGVIVPGTDDPWQPGAPRTALTGNKVLGAPWLKNRYVEQDPAVPMADRLNLWDNRELDTVMAKNITPYVANTDPNLSTVYREDYMGDGVLGMPGGCSGSLVGGAAIAPNLFATTVNDIAAGAGGSDIPSCGTDNVRCQELPVGMPAADKTKRGIIKKLCGVKPTTAEYDTRLNYYMSRIEASRASLFGLLTKFEEDADLRSHIKVGLIEFDTAVAPRVPLENPAALPAGATTSEGFPNMRRMIAKMNRPARNAAEQHILEAEGSTNISGALDRGARDLYADDTLSQRIMIFITDGYPTVGVVSNASLINNYAKKMGDGTYATANGDKITIFAVGVIAADQTLMNGIAKATPNGEAFIAKTVAELQPVMDQVLYQVKRSQYITDSQRYGLEY